MVWNRDALSPLLYIMPLGRSGKQNKNDNWMGHISFWFMLMMLVYRGKTLIPQRETQH
jgi:hypothetical protein